MASPFVELEVGEPRRQGHEPGQGLLSGARRDEARPRASTSSRVGDGIVRALYERPCQLKRQPEGVGGEVIWQKRVPRAPAGLDRDRARDVPLRAARRRAVRHRARARRLGGEPRDARVRRVAVAPARPREAGRAAHRHRPAAGHGLRGGEAGRRDRARGARRDRLRRLAEDERQPRRPRLLPDRAELGVPRRAPLRARVRARDRAARAGARHDGVVEGGARRARVRRLQPERARPHDPLGVLGARPAGCDGVGAGALGRAARRRDRGLHDRDDAAALRGARRPARGDRRGGVRPARAARVGRARGDGRASARRRTRRTSRRCRASRSACSRRARRRRTRRAAARPTRSSGRRGGRTSRHVHCSGSLSGRKRTSFVPCRKRRFSSLSKRTSTTSFGFERLLLELAGAPAVRLREARGRCFSSSSGSTSAAISSCRFAPTAAEPT